jgi:hypothetical protein
MPDKMQEPSYTHFSATEAELPLAYYEAIRRALFRWSQLESIVGLLAASLLGVRWLDALARLRGRSGFKVKNTFVKLLAELHKRGDDVPSRAAVGRAQRLYERRKEYVHSIWGFVSNETAVTIGIQEWSNASYDNFRAVGLSEIHDFATECQEAWLDIMKSALPFIHGANGIIVDDEDGMPRPVIGKAKDSSFSG